MTFDAPGVPEDRASEGRHAGPPTQAERVRRAFLASSLVAVLLGATFLALHWMTALLWLCVLWLSLFVLGLLALVVSDVLARPPGAPITNAAARSVAPWMFSKRGIFGYGAILAASAIFDRLVK